MTSQDSLRDLSDVPASEKETENLRQTCLNVNGIKSVQELKARKSGPFLFVEVTVGVLGTISASAAHRFQSPLSLCPSFPRSGGKVRVCFLFWQVGGADEDGAAEAA